PRLAPWRLNVTVPATQLAVCGSLKVSTVAVAPVRVRVLTQSWLFSCAVRPPGLNVNWMGFGSEGPDTPMADSVAVPCQVPANAAGIVTPVAGVVCAGVVCAGVVCAGVLAALLAWPAGELLPAPACGWEGDPRASSRTP